MLLFLVYSSILYVFTVPCVMFYGLLIYGLLCIIHGLWLLAF